VLQPQTTPQGRSTLPLGGSKHEIMINGLKKANKYGVMCVPKIHTRRRFKCQKCNVGVCFNPFQGVSHQITILRPTLHREKQITQL
jgi:hypothetical protein